MRKTCTALLVLAACSGSVEAPDCPQDPVPEYDRKEWGRWTDADKDCQDARQEVLIAESEIEVTFADEKKCKVVSGKWTDPYTGQEFTDPGKLDIDHMVALKDAHQSGGFRWSKELKVSYANNLENPWHLVAVSASANRSKGSKGPDEWLPPAERFRCAYISHWTAVKENYSLEMPERDLIEYMQRICDSGGVPALPQG